MKNTLILLTLGLILVAGYYFTKNYNFNLVPKSTSLSPTTAITEAPKSETTLEPTMSPTAGEEDLEDIIKQLIIDKHGSDASGLTISVSSRQGNYAKGSANEQGGGGMWFAVKVNGSWKLVYDGNGVITCDSLKDYPDYPISFIPECFDNATSEVVAR